MADASLTRRLRLDQAQETETSGICEDAQSSGEPFRVHRLEGPFEERRTIGSQCGDWVHHLDIDRDR